MVSIYLNSLIVLFVCVQQCLKSWVLNPVIVLHVAASMHLHGFCVPACVMRAASFSVFSIVWT